MRVACTQRQKSGFVRASGEGPEQGSSQLTCAHSIGIVSAESRVWAGSVCSKVGSALWTLQLAKSFCLQVPAPSPLRLLFPSVVYSAGHQRSA